MAHTKTHTPRVNISNRVENEKDSAAYITPIIYILRTETYDQYDETTSNVDDDDFQVYFP